MKTQAILAALVFAFGAGAASANDVTIDASSTALPMAHQVITRVLRYPAFRRSAASDL